MDYFMYLPNSFYHISSKFILLLMSWTIWICDGRIISSDICRAPIWPHSFDLSLSDVPFGHSIFNLETGKIYVSTFCVLFVLFFPTFSPFQSLLFRPFLHLHLLLASNFIGFLSFEFVFFLRHSLSLFPSFSSSILSSHFYYSLSFYCAKSSTIFWSTMLWIKVDASISIFSSFSSCITAIRNARIFSTLMHLIFTRVWHFLLHYYKNLQ